MMSKKSDSKNVLTPYLLSVFFAFLLCIFLSIPAAVNIQALMAAEVITAPDGALPGDDLFSKRVVEDLHPKTATMTDARGRVRTLASYRDQAGVSTDFIEDEVIITPESQAALAQFARHYGGIVLRQFETSIIGEDQPPQDGGVTYLVRVDLSRVPSEYIDEEGNIRGIDGLFDYSSSGGARLIALVNFENLKGVAISPNFVAYGDHMLHSTTEANAVDAFSWDVFDAPDGTNSNHSNVIGAWQIMHTLENLPEVRVAIIDGGFWLAADGIPNVGPTGTDFTDGVAPLQFDIFEMDSFAGGENPADCGDHACPWHGNSVAGVAVGRADNNSGTAGTGGFVGVPILFRTDLTMFEIQLAVSSAISSGADVINMSFGYQCNSNCFNLSLQFLALISDANSSGATIIASAGNDGDSLNDSPLVPCIVPGVICTGALEGATNQAAGFSNYGTSSLFGKGVDIWAPGTDIPVMANGDSVNNTTTFSGTSAAAPFVSGIVAMMKAADPSLNFSQVLSILQDTAWTDSSDSKVNYYVNALEAVLTAMGYHLPPDSLEPSDIFQPTPLPGSVLPTDYPDLTIHALNEYDYYLIDVPDYSIFNCDIENMAEGLGDIYLTLNRKDGDPSKEPVGFTSTFTATGGAHSASLLVEGQYEMRLASSLPQHYHLSYSLSPTGLNPDQFEVNNSFPQATQMPMGTYDVTLHDANDIDLYKFQVTAVPAILGAYLRFKVSDAEKMVTVELYSQEGLNLPVLEETIVAYNAGFQWDIPQDVSMDKTFFVKITGPVTRYHVFFDVGYDSGWLENLIAVNKFEFLDPIGPVISELIDGPAYVAVRAKDVQSGSLMLVGKNLEMTVIDSSLQILATGVPAREYHGPESNAQASAGAGNSAATWLTIDSSVPPESLLLIRIDSISTAGPGNNKNQKANKFSLHLVSGR